MRLTIMLPYKTLLDRSVTKVSVPTNDGVFTILPKHIDGTWKLKSGFLVVSTDIEANNNLYFAISEGFLNKEGSRLYISCFQVIEGESLETLAKTVRENLASLDEKELRVKQALTRLESDTVKRFIDFRE